MLGWCFSPLRSSALQEGEGRRREEEGIYLEVCIGGEEVWIFEDGVSVEISCC